MLKKTVQTIFRVSKIFVWGAYELFQMEIREKRLYFRVLFTNDAISRNQQRRLQDCRVRLLLVATKQVYPFPNDLVRLNKDDIRIFEALFKGVSTRFWATNH